MTDAISSLASKKTRFLFVKEKGNPSSDSFLIDFPQTYESLINSVQEKFQGKMNVRGIYNQNGNLIKSIDNLTPGCTIFASSKSSTVNKPSQSKSPQRKNSPSKSPKQSPRIAKTPNLAIARSSKSQQLSNQKKRKPSPVKTNKAISPKSKSSQLKSSSNTITPISKDSMNQMINNKPINETSPMKIESLNEETRSTSKDEVPISILANDNPNDDSDSDDFGDLPTFKQNAPEPLIKIDDLLSPTLSSPKLSISFQFDNNDSPTNQAIKKPKRRKTLSIGHLFRSSDNLLEPPPVSPIKKSHFSNTSEDGNLDSDRSNAKSDTTADERLPLSPILLKSPNNYLTTSTMAFPLQRNRKRRSHTLRASYASSQMQFSQINHESIQVLKMKSIESAIEHLTYFSSRNDIQNPIQANIPLDDDDILIYGKSDVSQPNKEKQENDTLDEFRDSDGSDLFGSSAEDDKPLIPINISIPQPAQTANDSNSIPFKPVPYESPIKIQNNMPSMNSPDKLDDFIESDDDISFCSNGENDNKGITVAPFSVNKLSIDDVMKDSDNDYFYDSDEDDSQFSLPPQVIKTDIKNSSKSTNIEPLRHRRVNLDHHRSSSKGSYYIYDTISFDLSAIIGGSLQTSESALSTKLVIDSNENKQIPRMPKKPSVGNIQSLKIKKIDSKLCHSTDFTNSTPDAKSHKKKVMEIKTAIQKKMRPTLRYASPPVYHTSSTIKKKTTNKTPKKKNIKNHYEEQLKELQKTSSNYKSDEDLYLELIDKIVGNKPQEILDIPCEVSATTLLPIMQNQQGLAWVAQGSLLASLQGLPEIEPSVLGYDEMVDKANSIISKHEWKFHSSNRSMLRSSINFNVAIIGPSNSGKSTFLRLLTDQLIADLVSNGLWRNSFVFIMNMENLSFALHRKQENNDSFPIQQLYKAIVKVTISSILWHFPPLLGTTKSLTKYFESVVSNKHSIRPFPANISEHDSELTAKLENIANIIRNLWNTQTAFEQFITAVFLFPKVIAASFQISNPFFILDHIDVCHRYLEPPSRFKQSSGFWLINVINHCLLENANFIIASKRDARFYQSSFITRKGVDVYNTVDIIDKSSPLIEHSKGYNFSIKTDENEDPIVIKAELCGGSPAYLHFWEQLNAISDEYSEFKMPEMYDEFITKTTSFIENVFVDENDKKPKMGIKSVRKLKRKQKR